MMKKDKKLKPTQKPNYPKPEELNEFIKKALATGENRVEGFDGFVVVVGMKPKPKGNE